MRLLGLLLVPVCGCQCFQPVSDTPDAAGVDAGLDAGPPECGWTSDCVPVTAPRDCAFSTRAASRSCLDGRCVFDCQGARVCTTQSGSCLSCDGGVPVCTAASCLAVTAGATGRLYRSCVSGASESLGTFVVRYRTGATCNFNVFFGDGGVFGSLDLLGDEPSGSGQVTEEPKVTCTVRALATALNRVELGCARCFYLLEWP